MKHDPQNGQQPVIEFPSLLVSTEPLAVNINEAARIAGVLPWTIREAIITGSLPAKKAGRFHIIQVAELRRWIANLEDVEPSTAPSILARKEKV